VPLMLLMSWPAACFSLLFINIYIYTCPLRAWNLYGGIRYPYHSCANSGEKIFVSLFLE
jgi:hypothetical protein